MKEGAYFNFCSQIARCYQLSLDSHLTPNDLRDVICSAISSTWKIKSRKGCEFLSDDQIESITHPEMKELKNQFDSEDGFIINVGTVHSVKGETHAATLYLDTYYQKRIDSERLIEFLIGNRPKKELGMAYHKQNLKIAHVAFSRPKHLLAFACNTESISKYEGELRKNGWILNSVSELIKR
jgi:hypothetical protein